MSLHIDKTALLLLTSQIGLFILFWIFGVYNPKYEDNGKYPLFQDVHVMIFLGFGYLLTFLKRYGFSSVGFTLLLGSLVIQWSMLCQGFYNLNDNHKIELGIESMYKAEIAAATVLISFCGVLGKTSVFQMFLMGFIEVIVYCANLYLGTNILKVADAGGSIFVHTFGAYFGLAVSYMMARRQFQHVDQETTLESLNESNYTSDIFAMIGTVFLWLYWPSFNAIELEGLQQERAILNTYLALASCCLSAFAASRIFKSEHKFDMVHIQNGTLAGGVAVGASVNLLLQPSGAVIIGLLAGMLCVFGFEFFTPVLEKSLKIPDTCGINNLHGMPGILAAFISAVMAGIASEADYHKDLYDIYPARGPANGSSALSTSDGRGSGEQAGYQLIGLAATIGIAVISGAFTGFLLNLLNPIPPRMHFDDAVYWHLPELSTSVGTLHRKTVEENTNSHHDNLAFSISIIEGDTVTDGVSDRPI